MKQVLTYLRNNAAMLLACLVVVTFSVRSCQNAERRAAVAEALTKQTKQLNDSTAARLAEQRANADSLRGLLVAAHDLDGKLIAGAKLLVAKRDTVVIHDTLTTTLHADSSRTAAVDDSTAWYHLKGTVTAPPCCEPLKFDYRMTRPAFSPSVGFVQRKDGSVAATVVWQGEKVEITEAFALPRPKTPRLVPYAEAFVNPLGQPVVGGGVAFRLFWDLSIAAEGHVGATNFVGLGLRKEFK